MFHFLFPFFGVAEGAECFKDFGDIGGFGAEESFGESFGGEQLAAWQEPRPTIDLIEVAAI